MSRFPRTRSLAATLGAAVMLTGCAGAEPASSPDHDQSRPVVISVSADSPEQLILGEIYLQTLQKQHRAATLEIEPEPRLRTRLDRLREGEADLVIGCTGLYLHNLDPVRARALADEIEREEVEDPADETYREYIGALWGDATSPDPSSAQGCAEEARREQMPDLPQSIVPTYNRALFNRDERKALTDVTRFLTTDEIATLIEDAEEQSSLSAVVEAWMPI